MNSSARNIRWRTSVVLAVVGITGAASGIAWAGPGDDHTRRGMVRPVQGGGSQPQRAPAPASSPAAIAPPRAAQSRPMNTPSAPAAQERHYSPPPPNPSIAPRVAPRLAPMRATPERVDRTRRSPTLRAAPAERPLPVLRIPSGVETARAYTAMRAARDSTVRSLAPREVFPQGARAASLPFAVASQSGSTQPRARSYAASPSIPAIDHTRRDLVRTIDPVPAFDGSPRHGSEHTDGGWHNNWNNGWNNGWNNSWHGGFNNSWNTWCNNGWGGQPGVFHDPYASWSSGIPSTLNSFGPYGNDPWSYANFSYGGPGWNLPATYAVEPYRFSYEPYLGADVWKFENSPFGGVPTFVGDPVVPGSFSNGLGGLDGAGGFGGVRAPEPIRAISPSVGVKLWRVNTAYDVRSDFTESVDGALDGEFSASIYAMRRAAGVNPGGLVGPGAPLVRSIANDPEAAQRVRAALAVFRNPPRRVVSETDALFMVAALSLALGDEQGASRAADDALAAGDGAMSTQLLSRAIRGEPLNGDR